MQIGSVTLAAVKSDPQAFLDALVDEGVLERRTGSDGGARWRVSHSATPDWRVHLQKPGYVVDLNTGKEQYVGAHVIPDDRSEWPEVDPEDF